MSKRKNLVMLFSGLLLILINGVSISKGIYMVGSMPPNSGYRDESTIVLLLLGLFFFFMALWNIFKKNKSG